MYKRILIATDGSPSSGYAVTHGIELARHHNAAVDVVYVTPPLGEEIEFYHSDDLEKELSREAKGFLADAVKQAEGLGVKASTAILSGEAEEQIVRFAEEQGCDLIVMGSHGHKGFVKLLIGSVAERVIGMAHCPVLVMKHH